MKVKEILELQKKLDEAVEKAHGVTSEDVKERKLIALLVELGEFANEIAMFKYWKKNKDIDKVMMLEEYADCIHFYASFLTKIKFENEIVEPLVISDDLNTQFLETFKKTSNFLSLDEKGQLESFRLFIGFGQMLEFDWDEVIKHYVRKNKINFERIANNY